MAAQAQDQVDSFIDLPKVREQFAEVDKLIESTRAKIIAMPKVMDDYKAGGTGAAAKKASDDLANSNKALSDSYVKVDAAAKTTKTTLDSIEQAKIRAAKLNTQEAKDLAAINQQNTEQARTLKLAAQAANSVAGSREQALVQIKQLKQQQDTLNQSTDYGKQKNAELAGQIDKLNNFLRETGSQMDKQRMNIGNYTNATEGLKSILEGLRADIASNTAAFGENSTQVQSLLTKYDLVGQILQKNEGGFASLSMEVRNGERALKSLNEQGLANTEGFKMLQQTVADAQRGIAKFQANQKLLESDAPTLTAMTVAAKGLGGAYAIGAGAGAIFGDEQGKIAKTTNQLIAIMTLLQGLDEVHQLLLEKNAVLTVLNTNVTNGLAAAKRLLGLSTEAATVAEETQAIAIDLTTEGIATQKAAVAGLDVANATLALSSTTAAGALEAAGAAAVEAAGGIEALDVAISAGALIIVAALAAGIYYLVKALGDMGDQTLKNIDNSKTYYDALNAVNDAIDKQNDLMDVNISKAKDKLEADKKLAEAAGKNKDITQALDVQVAGSDKQKATDDLLTKAKKAGIDISSGDAEKIATEFQKKVDAALVKAKVDAANQTSFADENSVLKTARINKQDKVPINQLSEQTQSVATNNFFASMGLKKEDVQRLSITTDAAIEANEKLLKSNSDLASASDKDYKNLNGTLEAYRNASVNASVEIIKTNKQTNDEIAAQNEDATKNRYELEIDANNRIIANNNSSEQQKLNATKNITAAKNAILDSEVARADADLKAETISQTEYNIKVADLAKERTENTREELEKTAALKQEYRLRDLQATLEADKKLADAQSAIYKSISENTALTTGQRTGALSAEYGQKDNISRQTANVALQQPGLDPTQKKSINDQLNSELLQSKADYSADLLKIIKSTSEQQKAIETKTIEDISQKYAEETLAKQSQYVKDLQNLAALQLSGKLSYENYLEDKKKLDDKFASESIKNARDTIKAQLAEYKKLYPDLDALQKDAQARLDAGKSEFDKAATPEAKQGASNKVAQAQSDLDNVSRIKKAEAELDKQLNDADVKVTEDAVKTKKDAQDIYIAQLKKTFDKVKEGYKQLNDFIGGLVKAQAEKQINALQDQVNANNQAADNEVSNINRSTLSAQQKADTIATINAKTKAQNDILQQQQQKEREKEAVYQKASTIFKVTLDGVEAVMTQLASGNIFGAVVAGVEAAAQLAVVIATPIPKYASGTASSGEGWALTDEYGAEGYKTPDGAVHIGSDSGPNLKYLERGTKIIPHSEVNNYKLASVSAWAGGYQPESVTPSLIVGLTNAVTSSSRDTVKAIKRYRTNVTVINKPDYWNSLKSSL